MKIEGSYWEKHHFISRIEKGIQIKAGWFKRGPWCDFHVLVFMIMNIYKGG